MHSVPPGAAPRPPMPPSNSSTWCGRTSSSERELLRLWSSSSTRRALHDRAIVSLRTFEKAAMTQISDLHSAANVGVASVWDDDAVHAFGPLDAARILIVAI